MNRKKIFNKYTDKFDVSRNQLDDFWIKAESKLKDKLKNDFLCSFYIKDFRDELILAIAEESLMELEALKADLEGLEYTGLEGSAVLYQDLKRMNEEHLEGVISYELFDEWTDIWKDAVSEGFQLFEHFAQDHILEDE